MACARLIEEHYRFAVGGRARYASGMPQVPLTREQVEEKVFSCAERSVENAVATRLFTVLNQIDQEPSFAPIWG